MQDYQQYIGLSRYARFREDLGRRETWNETVQRLEDFWWGQIQGLNVNLWDEGSPLLDEVFHSIRNLEVMPSMRTLMTAGRALELDNVAGFNCAYTIIETLRDFDEIFYILMCGTGVGYSVESRYVSQLPILPDSFHPSDTTIVVADSKIGWASSFRELLSLLWSGKVPKWDLSRVRPAGAPLKTFGGRASGPEPLNSLFTFAVALAKKAVGRKLTTLEAHDLVCKIADVVVVGGVRRSALIALCDLGDDSLRLAKSGNWWMEHPYRALANISAVYEEKPPFNVFLKEWHSLYDSHSGERGIFSRVAARNQAAKSGRRETDWEFGVNPCLI